MYEFLIKLQARSVLLISSTGHTEDVVFNKRAVESEQLFSKEQGTSTQSEFSKARSSSISNTTVRHRE